MEEKKLLYSIGANHAKSLYSLADENGTLESLISVVDYYKARAIEKSDFFLAGIADGLWNLIQDRWEFVPKKVAQ